MEFLRKDKANSNRHESQKTTVNKDDIKKFNKCHVNLDNVPC